MLTQISNDFSNPLPTQRLWHDEGRHAPAMGCHSCPDKTTCGSINVESAVFDCLRFCCNNPAGCDSVCRNNPEEFVRRVREIQGFSLENIPRSAVLDCATLPPIVPIIFHGNKRTKPFAGSGTLCLPFYKIIDTRTGFPRFTSADSLRDNYRIARDSAVILTGTSTDSFLERWWTLGSDRLQAIRALRLLNIGLVTTPNYSLFTDQPRWSDMHSMKRIGIVHQEFLGESLPAALHLNARTDRDWERWREFIEDRPEVTHVAFEFGTGAGWAGRMKWHVDQLEKLARFVNRPLNLLLRGGLMVLPRLANAYASVTLLETSTFVKTIQRKVAVPADDGVLRWRHAPTKPGELLDDLLSDNWAKLSSVHLKLFPIADLNRKAA
jgi:hypothetical protein